MGKYFADIHAMPDSQLGGAPCIVADSPEVAALRRAETFEDLMALAKALVFQLRYREALKIYDRAVALESDNILCYRQRAPRLINTLQPEKAAADLEKCRALGGAEDDISYRLGIARYLAGDYAAAMAEEAICYPLVDEEMGIAAMYWHTLSAWRAGAEPELLNRHYHPGMAVGHHTAYEGAMSLPAGARSEEEILHRLEDPAITDLEYSMLAYGVSAYLDHIGRSGPAAKLRASILPRDGFWISYAYLAAWNDINGPYRETAE